MPKPLIPHKSGPHRVACIALYRALLSRCSALPVDPARRSEIQGWIQYNFRCNRHLTSHRLVSEVLAVGYETHSLFGSSLKGSTESTNLILINLAKLPVRAVRPRPARSKAVSSDSPRKKKTISTVLDRPYKNVKNRRVPFLKSGNKIPFLAISKPQPVAITRMILRKILRREKLHNGLLNLEEQNQMVEGEDTWDGLIGKLGVRPMPSDRSSWAVSQSEAAKASRRLLSQATQENMKRATLLQSIVEQERALVEAEKSQVDRKKMEEKWQKWLSRKKALG